MLEGPRVVAGALDRGAPIEACYAAPGAEATCGALLDRLRACGVRVTRLGPGVLERVADASTPQPLLAVAPLVTCELDALSAGGPVVVAVAVSDPGNAGALVRSAEASGASGVVFCDGSVDPHNPKAVRASAGAIFGVPVVEAGDPVEVLDALGEQGRRRLGTRARGGRPFDRVDLAGPCALVLGSEAHGLAPRVEAVLDDVVTIPMAPPAESLNVAVAASVLCFEAARQRRARGGS